MKQLFLFAISLLLITTKTTYTAKAQSKVYYLYASTTTNKKAANSAHTAFTDYYTPVYTIQVAHPSEIWDVKNALKKKFYNYLTLDLNYKIPYGATIIVKDFIKKEEAEDHRNSAIRRNKSEGREVVNVNQMWFNWSK